MKKIFGLHVIIFLTIFLTSCGQKDITGKYSYKIGDPNVGFYQEEYIELRDDMTYESYSNMSTIETPNISNGTYSILNINRDINEIKFSSNRAYNYLYKNNIGEYFKCEIPQKNTFDLIIQENEDSSNSESDNIIFKEDGHVYISAKIDDYENAPIIYEYKKQGNKIVFKYDSNSKWETLFYIVEDGLFAGHYEKE